MELYDKLDSYLCARPRRTFFLFSVIILLEATLYCWWVDASGYIGEAESYIFAYADAIFNGIAPFTPYEDLRWEYPPLAYLTFLIPRLFTDDPHTYVYLFGYQIAFVCIIGAALLMKIAKALDRSPTPLLVTYVVSIFALNYFIFDRFDIVVAILMIGTLYLYMQKRYGWAILLIVLGMFIKLYPAILLPIVVMPLLADKKYSSALKQIGLFVVLTLVLIAPFVYWSPENVWNFITYHNERGLQIESVASSIILLFDMYGLANVDWNFSFGSYNINGGIADAIVPYMMPILVIAIVLAYILFYIWCRKHEDYDERLMGIVLASTLMVFIFIVFNKVFSAQYVVWITMPMIFSYAFFRGNTSRNMFLAIIAMNILTYGMVKTSSDLMNEEPIGIWLLLIRNLLVIVMMLAICNKLHAFDGIKKKIRDFRTSA